MSDAQPKSPAGVPSWDLADRLRKALRESGVGVGDMAAELDVSRNTVGNYINGHTTPNYATIRTWALRCGVPVEWLRYGTEPSDGPAGGPRTERAPRRRGQANEASRWSRATLQRVA